MATPPPSVPIPPPSRAGDESKHDDWRHEYTLPTHTPTLTTDATGSDRTGEAEAGALTSPTSLPGRRLLAVVDTALPAGPRHFLARDLNGGITNLAASYDDDTGLLCFTFDFETRRAHFSPPAMPFLVRIFDRRGNHLAHFSTREGFSTSGEPGAVLLHRSGNRYCYRLNRREGSYARIIEVGFLPGPEYD